MKNQDKTRRNFLKTGGASLAAMSISSSQILNVGAAAKKIRIGVVGGGFGCGFHWHEHPDCIVEAVSDLRADRLERLVKTYNCQKTYHSLEELVKDPKIDAVGIFTDGPLHVQHVVEAMKHGKHAITAVPAA
jgi:GFO/IDH/MocA oxidoreductase family protein